MGYRDLVERSRSIRKATQQIGLLKDALKQALVPGRKVSVSLPGTTAESLLQARAFSDCVCVWMVPLSGTSSLSHP
jgi:hypothetical protein